VPAQWVLLSLAPPPFSLRFARICTTGPPPLHPVFRGFFANMQDSDSCPRRFGLPSFRGLCREFSPFKNAAAIETIAQDSLAALSRSILSCIKTKIG
jgi:hypothetical protein